LQGFFKIQDTVLYWMLIFCHLRLWNTLTWRETHSHQKQEDYSQNFLFSSTPYILLLLWLKVAAKHSLGEKGI